MQTITIHFNIRFTSKPGQKLFVCGNIKQLGNDDISLALPLEYLNNEFWHGTVLLDKDVAGAIQYRYLLREGDLEIIDGEEERVITEDLFTKDTITLIDTWNHAGDPLNTFFTQPFKKVFLNEKNNKSKQKSITGFSHEFRVKAPLLGNGKVVCISGSSSQLGNWDTSFVTGMTKKEGWFTLRLNLAGDIPLQYKYGIYDAVHKEFIEFESGDNRIVFAEGDKKKLVILHDNFVRYHPTSWKAAGIAVPVFSLRSEKGFGVGEFADITLLVDWARLVGIKMIQILPVNDTTSTRSWMDSYPYSAISAFALHPIYINLEKIAGEEGKTIIKALRKKQKALNSLAEVDYEKVMNFKMMALKELFHIQKNSFLYDQKYSEFFKSNRNWLVPYAAFCLLRDKNGTADFSTWKSGKTYNQGIIEKLVSPSNQNYEEILFHYFIQYHLHIQLLSASEYAHHKGVLLKGDIPIGISRNSVDAWVNPEFYNMDQQAGAPPDDFAIKGQNWGFPTYAWNKMQADGYSWWRNRFKQMSIYFDAFRIDHILGFFRIWSIPLKSVEGLMGKFVPAIPVHISEFHARGIFFDQSRYCQPYITENILQNLFGDQVDYIKVNFLDESNGNYSFKESLNSQAKIASHIDEMADDGSYLKQGLFELLSNVILFEEEGSQGQQFHFRIAVENTSSFQHLDDNTRGSLKDLYVDYFYKRQNEYWRKEAMHKLPGLKRSTNMLICGEDLGMVPECVPDVMNQLAILSLEIQRMPKNSNTEFFHPKNAPYLSVVTPSTHDMSTIREWWEEDRNVIQKFYNYLLGHYGQAPYFCEPWISREIILQHLYSPAMWSVFQFQDLLAINANLRRENPADERINVPSDPKHFWRYRLHLSLESLIKAWEFNTELKTLITQSGRA